MYEMKQGKLIFDEDWPRIPRRAIQIKPPERKHFLAENQWFEVGSRFAVFSEPGARNESVQYMYVWLNDNTSRPGQWVMGGSRERWDFIDFADETLASAFRLVWC